MENRDAGAAIRAESEWTRAGDERERPALTESEALSYALIWLGALFRNGSSATKDEMIKWMPDPNIGLLDLMEVLTRR